MSIYGNNRIILEQAKRALAPRDDFGASSWTPDATAMWNTAASPQSSSTATAPPASRSCGGAAGEGDWASRYAALESRYNALLREHQEGKQAAPGGLVVGEKEAYRELREGYHDLQKRCRMPLACFPCMVFHASLMSNHVVILAMPQQALPVSILMSIYGNN